MHLQVKPGERIALDGVVLSGRSQVDEALVSGESLPLLKEAGSKLRSGALNLDGVLEYQASSALHDSQLQQLIRQVEQAQLQKAPVQQWVDRIAAVFVPVVLVIALLTLLGHGFYSGDWSVAILNAVAVLVIACPCALGLATPAALVVGLGQAARHGILLKNAAVLDQASQLQLLAFDKTGTSNARTCRRSVLVRSLPLNLKLSCSASPVRCSNTVNIRWQKRSGWTPVRHYRSLLVFR